MTLFFHCLLACLVASLGCRSSSRSALRDPFDGAHTATSAREPELHHPLPTPVASQITPVAAQPVQVALFSDRPIIERDATQRPVPTTLDSHDPTIHQTLYVPHETVALQLQPAATESGITIPADNSPAVTPKNSPDEGSQSAFEPEALPSPKPDVISLDDVITAVYASYPSLDAASRERQIAAAQQLAALGEFDVNLVGESMNEAMGYYKNYRNGIGLKQYNWAGGQTFAGYRIGRGFFEPWYKERQTNDGGEFKVGYAVPFLRDRSIDKRRAAVFQARIDRAAAEPAFQSEVIDTVFAASVTYWNWVAAGQRAQIARQALQLAVERQTGMETRAAKGDIARIELVDNERLIVSRQAKLVEAELKLQQAAIKLSLFLRDPAGTPLLADRRQLPADFPDIKPSELQPERELTTLALTQRPELRLLQLEQQAQELKMQQASNLALPGLDGLLTASQDVGGPADPKRDKSQFELEAGLALDVPLQRREAAGKLQEAQAKFAQLAAKKKYAEQSIAAEVQSARAGLEANIATLENARRTAELARQLADAERKKLERGDSNILTVNLREVSTIEADLLVVDAEANYYIAEAQLHAATAAELPSAQPRPNNSQAFPLDAPPHDIPAPQL